MSSHSMQSVIIQYNKLEWFSWGIFMVGRLICLLTLLVLSVGHIPMQVFLFFCACMHISSILSVLLFSFATGDVHLQCTTLSFLHFSHPFWQEVKIFTWLMFSICFLCVAATSSCILVCIIPPTTPILCNHHHINIGTLWLRHFPPFLTCDPQQCLLMTHFFSWFCSCMSGALNFNWQHPHTPSAGKLSRALEGLLTASQL